MPEPIISFSHNWNGKLCCKAFTTIRLKNDYKYAVGDTYQLHYKGAVFASGVIKAITHFKLHDLNSFMAFIDTGYDLEECKKIIITMYKNKGINWETQLLSFILIDQPVLKKVPEPNAEFYAPDPGDKPAEFPRSLFSKTT